MIVIIFFSHLNIFFICYNLYDFSNRIFSVTIKTFNNFTYFIISLFYKYLNFFILKMIVLFCTFVYLIFFIIFIYCSYKAYLLALSELSKIHYFNTVNDIAKLTYDFPILNNYIQQMPLENIHLAYKIHGIQNYTQFIYPVNKEVEILHSILNYEPEVASRFSSMVIQDIIDSHSREVLELTHHFFNKMIKCSLPLSGLFIVLGVIFTVDPTQILV